MHQSEEDCHLSQLTSSSSLEDSAPAVDRFQAIRERLDSYARRQEVRRQVEVQERVFARLAEVEGRLLEGERAAQEQACGWREMLCEMRVEAQQQERRRAALTSQRAQQIRQLKMAIQAQQKQEEDQAIEEITLRFEGQFLEAARELERESVEQAAQVERMEGGFEAELPAFHQRILHSANYHQSVLLRTAHDVLQRTSSFRHALHTHSQQQEKTDKRMMELILGTVETIQEDLATERASRNAMREKVRLLLEKASLGIR